MRAGTSGGRIKPFVKRLALACVALILAGVIYEQAGEWRDRKRYPQIGHSIDIGGRTLNLYCSGEGTPAVIFESGGHTAGYSWIAIQPEVSRFARACWYDRAGSGWSDPGPSATYVRGDRKRSPCTLARRGGSSDLRAGRRDGRCFSRTGLQRNVPR